MINWKRKMNFKMYNIALNSKPIASNWDIRNEIPGTSNSFEISYFQLAVSIGKSLLSHCEKYSPEAAAFARAYFQTIPFMLNQKKDYLSINYDNKEILRDFSKTTRIGEIAQGINYHYFKNYMNVCSIYDYKLYANNNLKIKPIGKSPDYVLVYNSGKLGLLESKGTLQANPSEFIVNGKNQCLSGLDCLSPYISDDYVSAISFATSSPKMHRDSTLYIVDPPYNSDWIEKDLNKHIKNEYAKWFYLLDMKDEYLSLKNNKNISNSSFKELSQEKICILKSYEIFTPEKHIVEFGILPWAKEYLIKGENYNELRHSFDNNTPDNNEEYFSDGMYIRII